VIEEIAMLRRVNQVWPIALTAFEGGAGKKYVSAREIAANAKAVKSRR
jgi:hypothetical protein